MTRQLEVETEKRSARRHKAIVQAVEYDLVRSVGRSGATLTGFAYKDRGSDTLLVIKAILAGRPQVCFVGSDDLGSVLIKAVRMGNADKLVWKDDQYAGPS